MPILPGEWKRTGTKAWGMGLAGVLQPVEPELCSEHRGHRHSLASRRPLPACGSFHGFMATSHFKSIKICHALPLCPTPHWGYGRDMCDSCFCSFIFILKMEHIVFGEKEHILSK